MDASALATRVTARDLTTHESAVRGVAALVAKDLGLPVPAELTVSVYGSRRVFEQGLIEDARLVAHEVAHVSQLDLETLGTPRGFTVRHLRDGSLPTYQLAFLMSDDLITKVGLPRVVDYISYFRTSHDRCANFARAFGQPIDGFELEVVEHLRSAVR